MLTIHNAADVDFAAYVRPGDTVIWGQGSAEPLALTRALMAQRQRIGGRFRAFVGISHADTVDPVNTDCVDISAYCGAGRNRVLAQRGLLDVWPWHYSTLAARLRARTTRVDVALVQVAPPDATGRYSLSVAHEYLVPALANARVILAEVNAEAPWTHGDNSLTEDAIAVAVPTSRALTEDATPRVGEIERAIATHAAGLVPDRATLQHGLGGLSGLIMARLADRRDLGVHSGMIGDVVADLMESGAVTNAHKSIDRGYAVSGTMMGTKRIHAFAHRNPDIRFCSTEYTHDADVLASIDRFVAINSAVEVDLTGQVNAEVANGVYIGAVGGIVDFTRGAHRSRGGVPIIALPSRAGTTSRIVGTLSGPATIARADAGVVVTEYGVADLRGLSLAQRARKMIDIAHPDDRSRLAG